MIYCLSYSFYSLILGHSPVLCGFAVSFLFNSLLIVLTDQQFLVPIERQKNKRYQNPVLQLHFEVCLVSLSDYQHPSLVTHAGSRQHLSLSTLCVFACLQNDIRRSHLPTGTSRWQGAHLLAFHHSFLSSVCRILYLEAFCLIASHTHIHPLQSILLSPSSPLYSVLSTVSMEAFMSFQLLLTASCCPIWTVKITFGWGCSLRRGPQLY